VSRCSSRAAKRRTDPAASWQLRHRVAVVRQGVPALTTEGGVVQVFRWTAPNDHRNPADMLQAEGVTILAGRANLACGGSPATS
jgi:hypothetical protein